MNQQWFKQRSLPALKKRPIVFPSRHELSVQIGSTWRIPPKGGERRFGDSWQTEVTQLQTQTATGGLGPVVSLYTIFGEGSPTKTDYRKRVPVF